MNKRKAGFTLTELIVVISVVAGLVAMFLPSITAIREYARRAQCRSNLRQAAVAVGLYQTEHTGLFPPAYGAGPGGQGPANPNPQETDKQLRNPLYPHYLRDLTALVCPSCMLFERDDDDGYYYALGSGRRYYFYKYNYFLNWKDDTKRTPKSPANVILYFDQDDTAPRGEWLGGNHGGMRPGGHIIFCDSHVEWVRADQKSDRFNAIDRDKTDGGYGDYL